MEIWFLFVKNNAVSVIITHQIIPTVLLCPLKPAYVNYPGYLQNIFKAVHKYILYFQICITLQVYNSVK